MAEEIKNNNIMTEAQPLPTAKENAAKSADAETLQSIFKPHAQAIQAEEAAPKNIIRCWADALTRLTDFEGRTTRYEFWAFQSVSLVIFLLLALIGYFLSEPKMVIDIFALYFLLPAASSATRRLHDIALSGWWVLPAVVLALATLICWNFDVHNMILLLFATLVYVTYLLSLLRQKNDGSDNKYGVAAKEAEIYHFESRAYISFMFTFMIGLWLIFIAYLLKF